ncbi:hypothetical protein [Pseudoalteromonas xiamenensis]
MILYLLKNQGILGGYGVRSCFLHILHSSRPDPNICAPGWSAKVIKRDIVGGVYRVTVAFSGAGVDGSVQTQLGQYFVEKDGELISRMVGFVGTGD